MSFATELFCNITFNRTTFNDKWEVKDKIEDLDRSIKSSEDRLKDLALMTEPNKLLTKEDDEGYIYVISREVKDNLELLEEYYIERYKLELLLDNWEECHTKKGLAIYPPKNVIYKSYLCGDFVNSTKYNNK